MVAGMLKRVWYFGMERFWIVYQWKLRFFRLQLKKWKRCKERKDLDQAYADLGSEVYGLYRQEVTDWAQAENVQYRLRQVEEAESRLLAVEDAMERIRKEYGERREEIRSNYAAKREALGVTVEDDEDR